MPTVASMVVNPKGTKNISITENGTIVEDVKKYGKASITVNVQGGSTPHIYGATWDGSSNPAWTRTDEAANFSDPNPYYSGMATTPSSPFDGLMPWSGMRRVTDSAAGELVEIPKFWYKWTRSGSAMQLQIADAAVTGFHVSPAHADRGDGVGERDYVYIGRYHCASDYKSKTGVTPGGNNTIGQFRTAIHNLDSSAWQWDYAIYWTIMMLYIVEYANWNTQEKIGYGTGSGSTGASDSMPYHTGTIRSSRTTYGTGVQYRYIEDMWGNVYNFLDGIKFSGASVYCNNNPADYSGSTGWNLVGERAQSTGRISSWTNPSAQGFEYALYPNGVNGTVSTYICDECNYGYSGTIVITSSDGTNSQDRGGFHLFGGRGAGDTASVFGTRLMVLPSARIN